jgi:ATP-dependent Lon protease
MNVDEPGWLADLIASTVTLEHENRQKVLDTVDPVERLQAVSIMLAKELDVLDLENRIHDRVQNEVDKSQREFYLREQMKAIAQELQDYDPQTREANDLRDRIEAAGMPEEVHKKAIEELERMQAMPMGMPEVGIIRTYIDWLLALPWHNQTPDHLDLKAAAKVLDANHYGLGKVKERIIEYMAVRKLAQGKMRSPILCFVGPPGVGKTSLGRSIAEALGRRFVRVSLGGIRDEAEIRGHRRTYIGALPGRIIQPDRQPARPGAARPPGPHGGDRATGIHRGREVPHRPPVPRAPPGRGARPHPRAYQGDGRRYKAHHPRVYARSGRSQP